MEDCIMNALGREGTFNSLRLVFNQSNRAWCGTQEETGTTEVYADSWGNCGEGCPGLGKSYQTVTLS